MITLHRGHFLRNDERKSLRCVTCAPNLCSAILLKVSWSRRACFCVKDHCDEIYSSIDWKFRLRIKPQILRLNVTENKPESPKLILNIHSRNRYRDNKCFKRKNIKRDSNKFRVNERAIRRSGKWTKINAKQEKSSAFDMSYQSGKSIGLARVEVSFQGLAAESIPRGDSPWVVFTFRFVYDSVEGFEVTETSPLILSTFLSRRTNTFFFISKIIRNRTQTFSYNKFVNINSDRFFLTRRCRKVGPRKKKTSKNDCRLWLLYAK